MVSGFLDGKRSRDLIMLDSTQTIPHQRRNWEKSMTKPLFHGRRETQGGQIPEHASVMRSETGKTRINSSTVKLREGLDLFRVMCSLPPCY